MLGICGTKTNRNKLRRVSVSLLEKKSEWDYSLVRQESESDGVPLQSHFAALIRALIQR
jgi:hypothetical protein